MARDLRLFYLYRLLATSYLWVPVSVFFMLERGLDWREIMTLGAIYAGVIVVVEVPTGAYADRIGRRQSMMLGALAMSASCLTAYVAYSFSVFMVSAILAGVSMALCSGADSAYLFDLLQENGRGEEYPEREGIASTWHLGGMAAAFAAGGFLAEIDLALPYLVTAGTTALAFVVSLVMRTERRALAKRVHRQPTIGAELGEYIKLMGQSFRDVGRNRKLSWIIFYSAVVFALVRVAEYIYQPYLKTRGFEIWETGLVFAGVYVLAAIAAHRTNALRRWLGESFMLWAVLVLLAGSYLLLHQIAGPAALALLAVQAGTKGFYSPLVKPILNREIKDSGRRATVLSVESIARRLAVGLVSLVAGFYGAYSAIYLCGGVGVAGLVVLLIAAKWAPWRASESSSVTVSPKTETAPVRGAATLD